MFNSNRKSLTGDSKKLDRDFLNQTIDAVNFAKDNGPQEGLFQRLEKRPNGNIFSVQNVSGSDVDIYGILKPTDPIILPSNNLNGWLNRQAFEATTPTADDQFCIVQKPAPDDAVRDAVFSGCSPCRINVTDESHTHAKAGTSSDRLESSTSGPAQIKWKESGTGVKEAFVLLGHAAEGGDSTDYAVFDFSYTDDASQIASNSNQFTTDESVIRISPTVRMETEGDFLYFVEGWMTYEFPDEIKYPRIQVGSTSFSDLTAGASTSKTINLGYSFAPSYPYVMAMVAHSASGIPWGNAGIPVLTVFNEAAGNFTLGLTNKHATESTGVVNVQWIATELSPKFDMISASKLKADVSLRSGSGTIHETVEVRGTDRITDEASPPDYKVPFSFHGWANAEFTGADAELLIKVIKGSTDPTSILSVDGTVTILKADSISNDFVAETP